MLENNKMANTSKFRKIFLLLLISLICLIIGPKIFGPAIKAQTTYDVRVTNIRFLYGVGKGPTHAPPNYLPTNYYRSYNMPGTLIEITAEMDVGSEWRSMYGDVKFRIDYTDGTNTDFFEVTIPSGQNTGAGQIPYCESTGLLDAWLTSGTTTLWSYTAPVTAGATGEYANANLVSTATASIYWDRADEPLDADFPPPVIEDILISTTTTAFKLFWNPVTTSTGSGLFNEDFYEYKIYYRADDETTWRLWNGSNDPTLRGLANNPASPPTDDTSLHFLQGRKYTNIPNLQILTRYYFYIAAVDVFGNEMAEPAAPFQLLTQPYSIQVLISDGIDSHMDFTNLSDTLGRSLRETNIKVEMFIVAAKTPPDELRVWYTYLNPDIDIIASNNTINQSAFPADSLFSVSAKKTGPNKWVAYLSTQTPVVTNGNAVRFIIESNFADVPVYSDYDPSDENPNDDEWNLYIGTTSRLKPWPARILNNVITNKHPIAYPAYYLSEDANVTIKVYDIKGRPVTTIMESAFRRGGQNIKEAGWAGTNKSRKKLGVGLYYMHFKARRVSDGKIILNKSKKIIIAK